MPNSQDNWIQRFDQKLEILSDKIDNVQDKAISFYYKEAIDRMESHADRLENKIVSAMQLSSEQHKELREAHYRQFENIHEMLAETNSKIAKHEHNFNILGFLVTSGLASLIGLFTWISGIFGTGTKH